MNSLEQLNYYAQNSGITFEDDRPYNIEFSGTLADHNFGIVEDVEFSIPNTFNGAFSNLQSLDDETTENITIKFDFDAALNPEVEWPLPIRSVGFRSNPEQTQGNPELLPWEGNPKLFFAEKIQTNNDFLYILNNTKFTFIDQETDFVFTITVSYPDPDDVNTIITHAQNYNVTVVETSPELANETVVRNYIRGDQTNIFAVDPLTIVDVAQDQVYKLVLNSNANNLMSIPDTVDTTGWDIQPNFDYPYQSTLELYGTKAEINSIIPQIVYHGIAVNPDTDTITYELRNIFVAPDNYLTASGNFSLTSTDRDYAQSWDGIFVDTNVDLTPERLMYSKADILVVGGGGGGGINLTNITTNPQVTEFGQGAGAGAYVYLNDVDLYNFNRTYGTDLLGVSVGAGGLYDRNYDQNNPLSSNSTNGGNSLVAGGGGGGTIITAYGGGYGGRGSNPIGNSGGCGGAANGAATASYINPGLSYQSSELFSVIGGAEGSRGGGAGTNSSGVYNPFMGDIQMFAAGGLPGNTYTSQETYPGSGGRGGWVSPLSPGNDPYEDVGCTDGESGRVVIRFRGLA